MSYFDEDTIALVEQAIQSNDDKQPYLALLEKMKVEALNEEERAIITDVVSDELTRHGLNPDDEPNEYGVRLERVIDKLTDSN